MRELSHKEVKQCAQGSYKMAGLGFGTCMLPRILPLSHDIGVYLYTENANYRCRWVWHVSTDSKGKKIGEESENVSLSDSVSENVVILLQPKSMKLPTTTVAMSFPFLKLEENNHKPIFFFSLNKMFKNRKKIMHVQLITSAFPFFKYHRERN